MAYSNRGGKLRGSGGPYSPADVMSKLYQPIRIVGGKRIYQTADDFADKINEYFNLCIDQEVCPTKPRLVSFLGFRSAESMNNYHSYGDDYAEVIDKAYLMIEAWTNDGLVNSKQKVNPIGAIFTLKNHYGWTDRTEVHSEHTLEVIPRETLELELERDLARIADSRQEAEMVEELISEPVDTT